MLQAKAEYEVPVGSPNNSDQNPRYVQMSVGLISVSNTWSYESFRYNAANSVNISSCTCVDVVDLHAYIQ